MTVKVNGRVYEIETREDLQAMREQHYEDWYAVRTSNEDLIMMELDNYLDQLDEQDLLGSTGSYGKRNEVMERVEYALAHQSRMYLHDIRCRSVKLDDQRIGQTRIEHKTGFAQWAYGDSEQACWDKLFKQAAKGIEYHWDPFKDEYKIVLPLADLLDYLASYSDKGLKCWFSYKPAKHQLQLQPVKLSYKRYAWVAELVKRQNPSYQIIDKDEFKG